MPFEDIRCIPVDGRCAWRDGRCVSCQAPTYGTDASQTPQVVDISDEDRRMSDYYVWCSNPQCPNYEGECVGDMDCPPEWATHDRS